MRVVIIGGGAAGVCAAGFLRRPDLYSEASQIASSDIEVVLLEKGDAILRKLRATGNGRCNFTNVHVSAEHYTGNSAAKTVPALSRFSFREAVEFFSLLGIPHTTMESGMTYPATLRADTVADRLTEWVQDAGVSVRTACSVEALARREKGFVLTLASGETITADAVLLATGGSYGIGKKEWSNGYTLAKQVGHSLTRLHPGIVSLAVQESDRTAKLSGIKVKAQVTTQEQCITDDVLFTEYGLSGIGILRVSNRILNAINDKSKELSSRDKSGNSGGREVLTINLLPDRGEEDWLLYLAALASRFPTWRLKALFSGLLSERIVDRLLAECGLEAQSEASAENRMRVLQLACHWTFSVIGAHKKDHGHLTCGGVDTAEWNEDTMESTLCPGLYLIGEVLDIQGECGGYNLHWAWASARAAAEALEKTARGNTGCV